MGNSIPKFQQQILNMHYHIIL